MDEEDGRLGPQVQQSGCVDVLTDASRGPCATEPDISEPQNCAARLEFETREGMLHFKRTTETTRNEVNHENVPGK